MCYEFSSWFEKARAKELHKAREKMDTAKQQTVPETPVSTPEQKRPQVKEADKVPA
jgi:hypothetical protein